MPDSRTLVFESYQLDLGREQLRRGEDVIPLTNKAFAVLRYLVEHAEQLVTRDALLEAVWPGTFVSDAALTVCIHELRQALGETAQIPQFIETVRGRGYRFLPPVTAPVPALPRHGAFPASSPQPASPDPQSVELVDREAELAQLHQWFATALQGERQVIFITGEPGIGKTTLVDAFVAQVDSEAALWIGHGQCIDQYGAGEAYLPLLEALGRLGRGPEGYDLIDLLRQHGPSWLVQMPALVPTAERETLQRQSSGTTRERMTRELAEAVEILTAERPLVLVLEDLHWGDKSTLDWLAYAARRRDWARLLILGTYRPVEAIVRAHPLRPMVQELQRHGQCTEVSLEYLSEAGVATYLLRRFGEIPPVDGLAQVIHQRTNGNPLFTVTVVNELVRQGVLEEGIEGWTLRGVIETVARGVPESVRQLIEQQLAYLSSGKQESLETASVAGMVFSVATIAAGVDQAEDVIEAHCAALARRQQFIQAQGVDEWPDGTVTERYSFIHALYQEVLYNRVPAGRRARLHQQIGLRQEAAYGLQTRADAAELAMHFVQGRDVPRAVQYLRYAGENALQLSAYQEALTHLSMGLEMLRTLPETPARGQQELDLLITLRMALATTKGYAASELEPILSRAWELCQQLEASSQRVEAVLGGLWAFYLNRAALQTTREVAEQLLDRARHEHDAFRLLAAHYRLGLTLFHVGECASAHEHLEQGIALYDLQHRDLQTTSVTQDLGVSCGFQAALVLWVLGYPDQALQRSHEALTLAQNLEHPLNLGYALCFAAMLHQFRREVQAVHERAEAGFALTAEYGFGYLSALAMRHRGWALAMQGQSSVGLAQIRQGTAAWQDAGIVLARPYALARLAEVCGHIGQPTEGLRLLDEALGIVEHTGECLWEAELNRLKGECLLHAACRMQQAELRAEERFRQALAVARGQQARSWELRAATSLAQLWQRQGKRDEARELLQPIYEWFTEGFDTADLQDAKMLLAELTDDGVNQRSCHQGQ